MRQRENLRRETIKRETEAALRDSGLRLSPQERAEFESRYIQERRKVEQSLRQQIEAQRQQQLPALIQQLKKEFQIDQPARTPATKAAESPRSYVTLVPVIMVVTMVAVVIPVSAVPIE